MKHLRSVFQATVLALAVGGAGFTAAAPAAIHDEDDAAWFGPHAKPYGVTFPEWTARLWQYTWSIPFGDNPLQYAGPNKCSIGQSGPVWFLVGNTGGKTERACDVPEGTALLFPIYDTFGFDSPNVCGQTDPIPVDFYRNGAAEAVAGVTRLSVDLDDKPIPKLFNHRHKSTVFSISMPADNFFNQFCGAAGLPRGIYSPAVDDGYYLMLKPLAPGAHTLHIQSSAKDFELDVTYLLNVIPVVTH